MTDDLPWSMSASLQATPSEPTLDDLEVTYQMCPTAPRRRLFRKCCACMHIPGSDGAYQAQIGARIEFVCGCGSHPSVMVCDGKVVGTSA